MAGASAGSSCASASTTCVDVALTYGDPACYDKVGFAPITDNLARAPLALQFPHGWLGQSLTERPLDRLRGPLCWVEALNSPAYW